MRLNELSKCSQLQILFLLSALITEMSMAHSQTSMRENLCDTIKYDTISGDFIFELNAGDRYYRVLDTKVQDNLIFMDKDYTKTNTGLMYASDSVFLIFWTEGYKYFVNYNDTCIDLRSISNLHSLINEPNLKRREKRKYVKSTLVDCNGIKYLRLSAVIVVIEIAPLTLKYPGPYCLNEKDKVKGVEFCERKYDKTFVIADILSYRYSK